MCILKSSDAVGPASDNTEAPQLVNSCGAFHLSLYLFQDMGFRQYSAFRYGR
jgi:hypothetical protein